MPTFYFYDPYNTFFGKDSNVFRDQSGKEIKISNGLEDLLDIGSEIFEIIGPIESREKWENGLKEWLELIDDFRNVLSQMTEHPSFTILDKQGQEFKPDWDEYGYPDVVVAMYGVWEKMNEINDPNKPSAQEVAKIFAAPFALASLIEIDEALLGVVMGSDAKPSQLIAPSIRAMRYLAIIKSLIGMHLNGSNDFAKKGAAARHATIREIRDYAINLYKTGKYPSAHKASIEIKEQVVEEAARLKRPLSDDRAQKTIYDWLRKFGK